MSIPKTVLERQDDLEQVAGNYRITVHYLGGSTVDGDWFAVKAERLDEIKLRNLAGLIQDISQQDQFSIQQNGNVVGIHLQHVTHVTLEKE
jgi:hypothetical protein